MRIKNFTTKEAIANSTPISGITIYKGTKKTEKYSRAKQKKYLGYGDDLDQNFRVRAHPLVIKQLKKHYPNHQEIDPQNIIVDHLNIVLGSNPEKICYSSMTIFNKQGAIQQTCDGEVINATWQSDSQGNRNKIKCDKPCKKGNNAKCPIGCEISGMLYFDILELLLNGCNDVVKLGMKTVLDLQNVQGFVDDLQENIATSPIINPNYPENLRFCYSPENLEEYKLYRPLILYRCNKWNPEYKKYYWYMNIKTNSDWQLKHDLYKIRSQNEHPKSIVVPEPKSKLSVAPSIPTFLLWQMDLEKAKDLKNLRIEHGWSDSAYEELFMSYLNIDIAKTNRTNILHLSKQEYQQIKKYIVDLKIKEEFKILQKPT